LDRVHVGIRENHTGKKVLDFGSNLVHFGPNLFAIKMAPIFVILVADCHFYLPATPHHTIRSPHFRQMPPKATNKTKNWGEPDRDPLYDLIQTGQVDIGDLSLENIEAVHQEHFQHRGVKNIHQNFKDFSAAFDLEAEYRRARRIGGGEGKLRRMVLIIICALFAATPTFQTKRKAAPTRRRRRPRRRRQHRRRQRCSRRRQLRHHATQAQVPSEEARRRQED
jgi:hypothetical protein